MTCSKSIQELMAVGHSVRVVNNIVYTARHVKLIKTVTVLTTSAKNNAKQKSSRNYIITVIITVLCEFCVSS